MGHLVLLGDNTTYPGFSLLDESNLAITFGGAGIELPFLILTGTTTVSIASGVGHALSQLNQLEDTGNNLTTVTISGFQEFVLGAGTGQPNSGDGVVTDTELSVGGIKLHSSLTLIDASAMNGDVSIFGGASNTAGAGNYLDGGGPNSGVTITYSGLTIRGGSGNDAIENDANKGIVTDGNGHDTVILGGAGAKASLGTGAGDLVDVGFSNLGTNEAAGNALGDKVTFGSASTATLGVFQGAEAGLTAGTTSIGLTKVLNAADGMQINFHPITSNSTITDETAAVALSTSLTQAENDAIALAPAGVAYFSFQGNEYFIATNNVEGAVSSNDAIVKLVGITDIHHATNSGGLVTLHV